MSIIPAIIAIIALSLGPPGAFINLEKFGFKIVRIPIIIGKNPKMISI
jgi:hypothetical protein